MADKARNEGSSVMEIGADMMMLLLGLFIIMFAFMTPDLAQKKEASDDSASPQTLELPTNHISDNPLDNAVVIEWRGTGFRVSFEGQTESSEDWSRAVARARTYGQATSARVVFLTRPDATLSQVIGYLEQLDREVAWTTPEVGLLE